MKRTTIFLDESTERDLKTIAYRRHEPVAQLVREALARYVASEVEAAPRLPSFVGIAESRFTDTSERVDELVLAAIEEHRGLRPTRTSKPRARRRASSPR